MVNVKNASKMVDELALMRYFPASDENARVGVVRMVCEMAASDEQVRWLVTRMLNLYAEWPGAREMRACFCSKFPPRDGISVGSTVYLDGVPSERAQRIGIAGPQLKALPAGHTASADVSIELAMKIAIEVQEVKQSAFSGGLTKEEIAAAPEWLRRMEGYES